MAALQERIDHAAAWWDADRRARMALWQAEMISVHQRTRPLPWVPRRARTDGEKRAITPAAKSHSGDLVRDPNPDVPLQSEAVVDAMGFTTTLAVLPVGEVWDEEPDATPHADGFYVKTGRRRRQPKLRMNWDAFLAFDSGPPKFFPTTGPKADSYISFRIDSIGKTGWGWRARIFGADATEAYEISGRETDAMSAVLADWTLMNQTELP